MPLNPKKIGFVGAGYIADWHAQALGSVPGVALAGGGAGLLEACSAYGLPLGEAFQLRDDLRDEPEHTPVSFETVARLAAEAKATLDMDVLDREAVTHLSALADVVSAP